MKDKIILVDADGVCLDWEPAFTQWMLQQGWEELPDAQSKYKIHKRFNVGPKTRSWDLVREFNESAAIETLSPLRDAVEYVQRLHDDHGYKFHCITSLSTHPLSVKYRQRNLDRVFGEGLFTRLVCLPTGADKDHILDEYRDSGCYWVEDKYVNAIAGLNAGLTSLLMQHEHNQDFDHPEIQVVKNWSEIYDLVTTGRQISLYILSISTTAACRCISLPANSTPAT